MNGEPIGRRGRIWINIIFHRPPNTCIMDDLSIATADLSNTNHDHHHHFVMRIFSLNIIIVSMWLHLHVYFFTTQHNSASDLLPSIEMIYSPRIQLFWASHSSRSYYISIRCTYFEMNLNMFFSILELVKCLEKYLDSHWRDKSKRLTQSERIQQRRRCQYSTYVHIARDVELGCDTQICHASAGSYVRWNRFNIYGRRPAPELLWSTTIGNIKLIK